MSGSKFIFDDTKKAELTSNMLHSKMMLASQGKKTDFLKTTFEDFLWIKTIYA